MDRGAECYFKYLSGDDSGMVDIIKDYKDGLTLYINGIVRNIFTAEEIMEETFFTLMTKQPKFKGKSSFKTWLYALGRNKAIDFLRKTTRLADENLESFTALQDEESAVETAYLKEENKIRLHKCMQSLNADYAQVLYLTYFEDFSNEQTAQAMNKSKRQIENLVSRARKALKSELQKEGFQYEEL